MFMVDDQLYTSSSSGNLVRRAWNPATGLPTGSATTVSGPGIDGQDWRARDAFDYAPAGFEVPNAPPVASFTNTCTGADLHLRRDRELGRRRVHHVLRVGLR